MRNFEGDGGVVDMLVPWTKNSMLDGADNKLGHSRDLVRLDSAGLIPATSGNPNVAALQNMFRAAAPPGCARNSHVATINLGFEVIDPGTAVLREGMVFARVNWGQGDASFFAFVDAGTGIMPANHGSTAPEHRHRTTP